ncbi:hypothetical protein CN645_29220 [Burkholderia sp. IDO3]|nr:hypothetical protein DCN14_12680 [Burkholderia sp. IDO3]PCD58376.1 hypothetical protein CN645_29220 [Burkholderia sp. IDO3]
MAAHRPIAKAASHASRHLLAPLDVAGWHTPVAFAILASGGDSIALPPPRAPAPAFRQQFEPREALPCAFPFSV